MDVHIPAGDSVIEKCCPCSILPTICNDRKYLYTYRFDTCKLSSSITNAKV